MVFKERMGGGELEGDRERVWGRVRGRKEGERSEGERKERQDPGADKNKAGT